MQRRDPTGVETGAIAALVRLDGARVVDVGCGDGRLTRFAAERAVRVYAFDPDRERVEKARASLGGEQLLRVRFGVHGVEALEVPRERFDVALCGWSL
jgi:2-polyprenyl-3-methyl-5-hydroxy-6-metoxy-1,4-benzoquinol methylase